MNSHHTKLKGDSALAFVIYDLTKKGHFIFLPTSENCPYDLVADHNGNLLKVQVKYRASASIPNSNVWSDKQGIHRVAINELEFDYFAIVTGDFNQVAYVPSKLKGCNIRFTIPESATPFYWWKDFESFEKDQIKRKRSELTSIPIQYLTEDRVDRRKIEWPSDEELTAMVWNEPSSSLAKILGVSDVAISRHCKRRKISKPPRGYWTT